MEFDNQRENKLSLSTESVLRRNVGIKTILGGSTLAMCYNFPPKLFDVTFRRSKNPLRVASF